MQNTLSITTERPDDTVLLIHLFLKVDFPQIIDRTLKRHGNQKGLSWGWLTTIWLAHVLTRSDHRKVTVRDWIRRCRLTLEKTIGFAISETDFTDDRLTLLLHHFSDEHNWHQIEAHLCDSILLTFALEPKIVRVDATTLSGYHSGGENALFQFGKSKEHPELLCTKVMQTTLDPLGLPLTTQVVPGNQADDPLYVPAIARAIELLKKKQLLFVGDTKMSALDTRCFLHRQGQFYLMPLALVGETAKQLPHWVQEALKHPEKLETVVLPGDVEKDREPCKGYSFERDCLGTHSDAPVPWRERIFVCFSPIYAQSLKEGLAHRIASAQKKLQELPPASATRKKYKTGAELTRAAQQILKAHHVTGIVTYSLACEKTSTTQYVGCGRGGPDRQQVTVVKETFRISEINIDPEALKDAHSQLGWRAYACNDLSEEMTLLKALTIYRQSYTIERGFHRLKGVPLSLTPLYVQRDDQVKGLTHFLSLGVRFLTLMEYQVRHELEALGSGLVGLHPENPKKETRTPTAERILEQFCEITLTSLKMEEQEILHITPLTPTQCRILEHLGLPPDIYSRLVENSG